MEICLAEEFVFKRIYTESGGVPVVEIYVADCIVGYFQCGYIDLKGTARWSFEGPTSSRDRRVACYAFTA